MASFEVNKIFAAVLCAGVTIWVGGILADHAVQAKELETDAVAIAGEAEGGHSDGDAAAEAGAEPILALLAAADVEKGAKLSKACAACHSFDKGGAVKQGPNLWGAVGRAKASVAGFDYSAGLKAKGGNWDYVSLNQFLWKPKKYVSDTKMNFIGLKKPEDRAAIIAWLRAQADAPVALPTEAEVAADAPQGAAPAEAPAAAPTAPATDAAAAPSAPAPTPAPTTTPTPEAPKP